MHDEISDRSAAAELAELAKLQREQAPDEDMLTNSAQSATRRLKVVLASLFMFFFQ